jgi:hypothetical protein
MDRRAPTRLPQRRGPRGTTQTRHHTPAEPPPELNPSAPEADPQATRQTGTLPMARHLTGPDIEKEIQSLAASAPPMTEDQRARIARMLRLDRRRQHLAQP